MRRIEDIKFSKPIRRPKTVKTGVSASFLTLGAEDILLSISLGSIAQAHKFYFYHASASTSAAGGTAFGTNPTLTTAATACLNYCVLFEGQTGRKQYLIVLCSKQAASNSIEVSAFQFGNRAIPPTTNLSISTTASPNTYTSITRPLV